MKPDKTDNTRSGTKKFGRRRAGSWGPPRKGNKKVANKATRRIPIDSEIERG